MTVVKSKSPLWSAWHISSTIVPKDRWGCYIPGDLFNGAVELNQGDDIPSDCSDRERHEQVSRDTNRRLIYG